MRLSIIIPVFNAGNHLLPLLESLGQMPDDDIEFIAIDDGATDQSLAMLLHHAAQDRRLNVIQQANQGVAATRNAGLAAARGEYVWFVDADDLVMAAALPALFTAASTGADVIAFDGVRFANDADPVSGTRIYHAPKPATAVTGGAWLETLLDQKELRHFVWLYWCRRDYLHRIGLEFSPGMVHEDVAWVTEVLLRARTVRYVDVTGYQYRMNAASLTGSPDDAALLRRIHSYFTVVAQLRALNLRVAGQGQGQGHGQGQLAWLLQGEVVGQALQVFELAKQLSSAAARAEVMRLCRTRRFAQSLWGEALNFKRKRQVVAMWLRQQLG